MCEVFGQIFPKYITLASASELGEIHESRTHTHTHTNSHYSGGLHLATLDESVLCYDSERGLTLDTMVVLCCTVSAVGEPILPRRVTGKQKSVCQHLVFSLFGHTFCQNISFFPETTRQNVCVE